MSEGEVRAATRCPRFAARICFSQRTDRVSSPSAARCAATECCRLAGGPSFEQRESAQGAARFLGVCSNLLGTSFLHLVRAGTEEVRSLEGGMMQPGDTAVARLDTQTGEILQEFERRIGSRTFNLWVRDNATIEIADDQVTVNVHNKFLLSWLQQRYRPAMLQAVQLVVGDDRCRAVPRVAPTLAVPGNFAPHRGLRRRSAVARSARLSRTREGAQSERARRGSARSDVAGIRRPRQGLSNRAQRPSGYSDCEDCALLCATGKFAIGARFPSWSSRNRVERRRRSLRDCGTRPNLSRKTATSQMHPRVAPARQSAAQRFPSS